jgi:asparagine synthase (glutamine-hydrolysing)
MCGINGVLALKKISLSKEINSMNDSIIHRGPDDQGTFTEENENYSIALGMRRLSIIDLKQGKQPIFTEGNTMVIVFNGEIYNFQLLRKELIDKGVSFKTKSDTEVVIKLYELYGVDSFAMLDGMFAFSIYDKKLNKVFIARDFFGEKPLYYSKDDDNFIWSSELKSIIKIRPSQPAINKKSLNLFLQLTYIPAPYSIYENIYKLEANHYLEFDCSSFSFEIHKIEQSFQTYSKLSKPEAKKITHDLVQQSVVSRSISDVPLGTFLSGGVDSSIVSLCLSQNSSKKIETFSIGFDKKSFDETDKSRTVAKLINSNHHEFIVSEKDFTSNIDEIILNMDEPFADSSALASYVVSDITKNHVKVALTGDGGDEVFGGYNKYYMGNLNYNYTNIIPLTIHKKFVALLENLLKNKDDKRGYRFKINRLLKAINYNGDFYYSIISLGFQPSELKEILTAANYIQSVFSHYKNILERQPTTLTDFRNIDKMISLEGDMLVKVDRTSMLNSLECRAPFLNKEIWNFTSQLPEDFLIKGWDKKHILKEAFKHYFPKNFLNKSKKGFEVPVGDWLRADLKNELISYIDKRFIEEQNIFQFEVVFKMVHNHLSRKIDNTFRVWTFYCFQKWYSQNYKK